eukprot:TCONS_00020813-protein
MANDYDLQTICERYVLNDDKRFRKDTIQEMVCIKKCLGVSSTRRAEIESKVKADLLQRRKVQDKPNFAPIETFQFESKNVYVAPLRTGRAYGAEPRVSAFDIWNFTPPPLRNKSGKSMKGGQMDPNLKQKVKEFIEKPQPKKPHKSLRIYKNPATQILRDLEKMNLEDNESEEEDDEYFGSKKTKEPKNDLPVIVVGGNTYKSKWTDARDWYYKNADEVCSYLRIPPDRKPKLLTIHDVFKELKRMSLLDVRK